MIARTIEWLNANRYRRYPFKDDAALALAVVGDAGDCALTHLPNNVLLDFQATALTPDYVAGAFGLNLIWVQALGAGVAFEFSVGNKLVDITVPAAAAFPYTVTGLEDGIRYAAVFGEGCLDLLCDTEFDYDVLGGELQQALLAEQTRHRLDSVAGTTEGQANHEALAGTVHVEAGYNCDPVVTPAKIRLTAGRGWGAGRYCTPLEDGVISCRQALLRLNGQIASEDGNVGFSGIGVNIGKHPTQANTVLVKVADKLFDNMKCG